MPNTIDVIRTLTVQGRSVGMDRVASDLKTVDAAQTQVAQSSAKLVSATATVERGSLSAAASLDRQTKALDPLAKALAQQERLQRAVGTAQAQGITLSAANERAVANAAARVRELQESTEKHTASLGLNRMQMMESVHILKSLADETIATGQPLRALALEGGRIAQVFSSGSGGVAGTLKGFGSALSGLVPPAGLVAGAVAGIGVAAAAAALSWERSQHELAASLEGTGRASGSTLTQLNAVAEAGARAGRISIGSGRELAGDFAHAGISASQSQALIASAPAYARASGLDLSDAGKAIATAFADPEKGLEDLNKTLGFLNDRVMTTVHVQEAAGNLEGARQAGLNAYLASLKDVTDHTWTLSRIFEQAKSNVGRFIDDFGKQAATAIGGQSHADELQSLRDRLPNTSNALPGYFNTGFVSKEIDRLQRLVDQEAKTSADDAARKKAADDANTLSLQAREVVRSILPEIGRNETYQTQVGILQRALANPAGLNSGPDTGRALGQLAVQHAFSDPFKVMQQDAQLALDAANATSLAERAAVEARRAELAVLRESGDITRAAAAAQGALNLEITKANAAADEALEKSKQNAALVGLSPIERQLAEIHNRYQDLRDKNASPRADMATSLAPVDTDLRSAGDTLAQALRDIAAQARASFLSVDGKPVGSPYGTLGGVRIGSAADAIKSVESGGNYGALGPITKTGDRAYGAYQVTGANISAWSKDALGYSETPSQFLGDKAAQDAVFNHQFGASMARYGNASDAAAVWFTGRPLAQGAGARDVLGTTGAGYVDKFNAALGGAVTVRPTVASTAGATYTQAEGLDKNATINDGITSRLADANRDLENRNKLLGIETSMQGQSTAAIEAAVAAQQKLNEFSAQGFDKLGPQVWQRVTDGVRTYQRQLESTITAEQKLQEQQQKTIGTLDSIRDASKGALSTFITDVRNGQSAGKALADVMSGFETKLLGFAEDQALKGLFGATGTANGGALGGGFASLIQAVIHHEGGIVGQDGRLGLYPAAMFAGAPRHHSGYGLAADERPAILQTGEAVVSRADLAAARAQKSQAAAAAGPASSGAMLPPIINNYASPGGAQVDTKVERGPDGRTMIHNTVVDAVLADLNSNGKISRAMNKFGGVGRTG